jgi:hypothetical protein
MFVLTSRSKSAVPRAEFSTLSQFSRCLGAYEQRTSTSPSAVPFAFSSASCSGSVDCSGMVLHACRFEPNWRRAS